VRAVLLRLAGALPALAGVVLFTFVLTRVLPGDTAAYFAGPTASPAAIEQIRHSLGLDRPLPEQFLSYVAALARGDMGMSLTTGQPVLQDLAARLPASAELTLAGLFLAVGIAVPLGIVAAVRQGSWMDHLCRVVVTAGVSLPVFFTGLLLVYVFYFLLDWSPPPVGRLDAYATPPPTVTGLFLADAVLGADFVRTARASGLSTGTVVLAYAFRNALLPVVTTLGMVFSFLLGANVLVEKVFAWPGVGSYVVEALIASDFAPVQGFVLTMAVLYVLLNLGIDLLLRALDPRVRTA